MAVQPNLRLGQRLRARRTELGRTLSAVAQQAGLSVPYIANLEKGRGNPTLDVVVSLAAALGITPAELLGGDEPIEQVDELLVDLPPVLVAYAQGRILRARTRQLAIQAGTSPENMSRMLLQTMASAPRPPDRELTEQDCRRLLDAFWLILTDPGDRGRGVPRDPRARSASPSGSPNGASGRSRLGNGLPLMFVILAPSKR